jgi:transposase
MGSNRRKYDKEFKLEAIRSYENGDRSQREVERELGITQGLLGKWVQSLEKAPKKAEAFPGHGRLTETEARIQQLERENAQLRQDKEILKKVLKIYSREEK